MILEFVLVIYKIKFSTLCTLFSYTLHGFIRNGVIFSILRHCLVICKFSKKSETKYIKLNTKPQILFFCRLNESLMTFLYTLIGATRKQKEKKVFFLKCITKSNFIKKKLFFSI